MVYDIKLEMWHQVFDNFKQNVVNNIIYPLPQSRLGRQMVFKSYGHIYFDEEDTGNYNGHVEELESFNRNKTNCLIFDLLDTEENHKFYTQLFIYNNGCSKDDCKYAFVINNPETGQTYNKFCIGEDICDLWRSLQQVFNGINRRPLLEWYSRKTDEIRAIRNKNVSII